MNSQEIHQLVEKQRDYFFRQKTLPVKNRLDALKKLYKAIKENEDSIYKALKADLGKSEMESYMCEAGLVLSEISYMLKNTRRFAKEHTVKTPLAHFASRSYTKPSPRGNVLIMSPWNYPFMLTIEPLVDAIAAGNTAIVKPSAYSPETGKIIEKIIKSVFPPEYVAVVIGGRAENTCLLDEKFDYIFFTGSQNVGKEVLRHAAENLTPATLELGGKSPCIVDETADIKLAAKRITFGKFLNCGQTCVAPDYILCHESIKDRLVQEIKKQISLQFGTLKNDPLLNPDYGKIINERHFERLCGLIDAGKVAAGGRTKADTLQIEPTVMNKVTWEDAVMQEEIFGPILPVLTFSDFKDVFNLLKDKQKPLALYLFTAKKSRMKEVTERINFGGGCLNDVIIHLATSEMGFGGTGESGMGAYHGKRGFDTFSHTKSIVDKKTWLDLPMRYQPYKSFYGKLLRMFLK